MAHGILLVLSDPVSAEADAAYNEWYDNVHLPEILTLAGFTSAKNLVRRATGRSVRENDLPYAPA